MDDARKEDIWQSVLEAAKNCNLEPIIVASSLIEAYDKIFNDNSTCQTASQKSDEQTKS